MILFLHNRYRTTGGEERVVDDLLALVRAHLEPAELLERDSARTGPLRAAAGLLGGGLGAHEVADAVRLAGARVLHAHNLNPTFGWRALAAAKHAGARVVLHLHQYRLVCANGVCFTHGERCTRCHGRNTLPGVALNCRANRAEAFAYGAALAMWQHRMAAHADAVIVPSAFARERLRELGAPLDWERVHVLPPPVPVPAALARDDGGHAAPGAQAAHVHGSYALVVSRLSPEKGVDVAIDACRLAGMPLVIAGDGPQLEQLRVQAAQPRARMGDGDEAGADVRFVGRVDDTELARLRAGAALAIVPSRSDETFGMAAAEAMAAGLRVAASRVGALPELVEEQALAPPGDAAALAEAIERVRGDPAAGERGRARVMEVCAPRAVADGLARIYGVP